MPDLPPTPELRRLVRQHGSYRATGIAIGVKPHRVAYAAKNAHIPSPRTLKHLLVCVFCGMVASDKRPVARYHLVRSTHQMPRRAGSLVICDDCMVKRVTPRRKIPLQSV